MHAYIVAPTNLPPGFKFTACLPDQPNVTFEAEVPEGGVVEGQMFLAPLPDKLAAQRKIQAPIGQWKDGLFSCLSHGIFHPHLWCSFCCCNIMLGQVMSRMKFSWLGSPTYGPDASTTFKIVAVLVASFLVFVIAMDSYEYSFIITGETNQISPLVTLCKLVAYLSFLFWSIYSMSKTRFHIRAMYAIPEYHFPGYEDLVLSTCCCCCTVAQMARHTGDYDRNKATVFTNTGLPNSFVPGIV